MIHKEKVGVEFLFICPKCNQGEFKFLSIKAIENLKELNCSHCLEYSKVSDDQQLELRLLIDEFRYF